jgi:hypothetical protein
LPAGNGKYISSCSRTPPGSESSKEKEKGLLVLGFRFPPLLLSSSPLVISERERNSRMMLRLLTVTRHTAITTNIYFGEVIKCAVALFARKIQLESRD